MATIDGISIHVTSEKPSYSVRVSTYPIEGGAAITDHVEPQLITLNITGLLVNDASKTRNELLAKMNAGATVKYIGRNSFMNCVITSFESTHEYTNAAGMGFTMQLQEIKKVKSLFSKKLPKKIQTVVKVLDKSGRKQTKTTKKSASKGKTSTSKGKSKGKSKNKGPTGKKHTVRDNQTWEALAYTYKVPLKTLRSWNPQIPKGTRLKPGMVVIVG
ncbi:LysM peptidoglycan-binding domain-containing protein [Paenibacillus alvei]|uniref:LysM peptidoglycan-binding domain-containing protein n=1 Tax=Paenibacillus alvei TaxID=44250 RepID=A0ABT4GQQ0_PAEAL|nr:LysM domain-containing protein [Paenibacillus alvei]MCY9758977.1 LysM peptidoglycan-binding domain-containing protein [Paenibacillus alvei]MCY9770650.1 LysM peptidoglycan-binding domain-containing protein [Paenibacillus alvei]